MRRDLADRKDAGSRMLVRLAVAGGGVRPSVALHKGQLTRGWDRRARWSGFLGAGYGSGTSDRMEWFGFDGMDMTAAGRRIDMNY